MFNSCSIRNKLDDLIYETSTKSETIFAITETWLNAENLDNLFSAVRKTHVLVRSDRDQLLTGLATGGGVLFLIPKKFTFLIRLKSASNVFESLWIDFYTKQQDAKPILGIGLYYVRPNTFDVTTLLANINENCNSNFPFLVLGDFNLPGITNWKPPPVIYRTKSELDFLEKILELGLTQIVSEPTHKAGNILDLVFVSEPNLVSNLIVEAPFSTSDHNMLNISIGPLRTVRNKAVKLDVFRNFRKADISGIRAFLDNINWDFIFAECVSVNQYWRAFRDVIDYCINTFVPLCSTRQQKFNWSPVTRSLHREQQRLHKRYKRTSTKQYHQSWLTSARAFRKSLRGDLLEYERNVLNSPTQRKFWSYIKSVLSPSINLPSLNYNNKVLTCDREKANAFVDYFTSVFVVDDGNLPNLEPKENIKKLHSVACDPYKVFHQIQTSVSNKLSFGVDFIPPFLLSKLSLQLSDPLSRIFCTSMATSEVPNDWRVAKVVPISKKGLTCRVENFRPISLISSPCKLMETIIRDALIAHLTSNKIITPNQHGFRSQASTVTQLISCLNYWINAIDKHETVDIINLDIAKAFDTVSHQKLIYKLFSLGVEGQLLNWIQAYLTNRSQFVCLNNSYSDSKPVISGVPQGSVLGPVLFLVYINDLVDVLHDVHIKLYADDAKIYLATKRNTPNLKLQADLNRLATWAKENQLSLAIQKCCVLHLGHGNYKTPYILDNVQLPVVNSVVDLGVVISDNLKFSDHCYKIARKCFQMVNLIFKVFRSRDKSFLLTLFQTYIRSRLEYASEVWSPYLLKDIDLIENVQRKFSKRIPGMGNYSYNERLSRLNLESLEYRRIVKDLVLVYNILHRNLLLDSKELFEFSYVANTRGNSYKLQVNAVRLDIQKYFFVNRSIKIWNSLPDEVILSPNVNAFKSKVQQINLDHFLRGRALEPHMRPS